MNADFPIIYTFFGILKETSLKQFWNAPLSIIFKFGLVTTFRRFIQLQNASLPIVNNDFGKITSMMSSLFLNVFDGIFFEAP